MKRLNFILICIGLIFSSSSCEKNKVDIQKELLKLKDVEIKVQSTVLESNYITVEVREKINEDMSEFEFEIVGFLNLDSSTSEYYSVEKIKVMDTKDGRAIQEIAIPDYSLFGNTLIQKEVKETLGFELEDLNFDGYKDIRLYDVSNGNYRQEWIYFVWNKEKGMFENDKRLNGISLANFNQEEKLIYGMERGSAASHYYYIHEYIDEEIVLIKYESHEGIMLTEEKIGEYLLKANISTNGDEDIEIFYEYEEGINKETMEMEIVRDEYVFYNMPPSKIYGKDDIIDIIDGKGEIGKMIRRTGN